MVFKGLQAASLRPVIIVRGDDHEYGGGPRRSFDGPRGGFGKSSSKPLLLLKSKNNPQDHQIHDQDHPRARY